MCTLSQGELQKTAEIVPPCQGAKSREANWNCLAYSLKDAHSPWTLWAPAGV
uniref:Uncharacterized protein n=1 Tax=Anguilla anguilla TaxID=7936 RepID=A0A0E9SKL8_ANGAN